jgi:hypothetical protein
VIIRTLKSDTNLQYTGLGAVSFLVFCITDEQEDASGAQQPLGKRYEQLSGSAESVF